MATINHEKPEGSRSIGESGNCYRGLSIYKKDGKCFLTIDDCDGHFQEQIPARLFNVLNNFEDSREEVINDISTPYQPNEDDVTYYGLTHQRIRTLDTNLNDFIRETALQTSNCFERLIKEYFLSALKINLDVTGLTAQTFKDFEITYLGINKQQFTHKDTKDVLFEVGVNAEGVWYKRYWDRKRGEK